MADKPVIARLVTGETYGFASAKVALDMYPDAVIVSHEDGTPCNCGKKTAKQSEEVKPDDKPTD